MGDDITFAARWYDLSSEDIAGYLDRWLVIPVAQIEGHGPFLPAGTDKYIVEHVALGAATPAGALVAPSILTGNCFDFERWHGYITTGNATYVSLIQDYVRSLRRQGFTKAVFVLNHTGHNFNAVDLALSELRLGPEVDFRLISTSALAKTLSEAWAQLNASSELSAMMALRPDLVRWEEFQASRPAPSPFPRRDCLFYGSGDKLPDWMSRGVPVGVPGSSAELGRQFLDTCIRSLASLLAT